MKPELAFREDGRFTIVQFTDLHWKNGDKHDVRTRQTIEAVLAAEQADLVLLTGDTIDSTYCDDPKLSFIQAICAIESHGLPWAAVFGNHDTEQGVTRQELMELIAARPGCLAQAGPSDLTGVGNYILPIAGSKSGKEAARLYCLDSGDYAPEGMEGYGWIGPDQSAWYLSHAAANAEHVPALAFFHIPFPEYEELWWTQTCYGTKLEPVCAPKINSGFYAALLAGKDVAATFVGHDHVNDYYGDLHGIRLYYGRATGHNTYGFHDSPRGARIIRLREGQRELESWIRLQDGTVIAEQEKHDPEA
jgi:hypothetical protein